jgi:predicted transcriptional regulator
MVGKRGLTEEESVFAKRMFSMIEKVKTEIELMQRHIEVLRTVVAHQPIGIMKLSELLDLPFHRIRYSLRVLEQMGYIRASPNGAVATDEAENLLLRLNEEIEDMVSLLEGMKKES